MSDIYENNFYEKKSKLSKSHKKIADYIVSHYDKSAFMTAAKMGKTVDVSESTVVRFAVSLGFEGYPEMQKAMQEMVLNRLTSVQRLEVANDRIGDHDVLSAVLQSDMDKLRQTGEILDRDAFRASVNALLGAKRIYIVGVRSAAPLANFLGYYLGYMFNNVHIVTASGSSEMFEKIVGITAEDAVIAFSFPRYSTATLRAAGYCRSVGATVVGVTDFGSGVYLHETVGRMFTLEVSSGGNIFLPMADLTGSDCRMFAGNVKEEDLGKTMRVGKYDLRIAGTHLVACPWLLQMSQEMFDNYIAPGTTTQVSLTIENYAYTKRVLSAVQKMDFIAISPYQLGATAQVQSLVVERLQTLAICAAVLIVVLALLCVPFVDIAAAVEAAKGTNIKIGAENVHFEEKGAYTGEVSCAMLKEIGVQYVIIGHSERRQYFGETDETVNKRALACHENGITPIICVGENLSEREKRILTLRFFRGKTQMEVADEIGISQAQVSRLEKNALKFMKKYVQ